jgi:thiol-disulfide isomerase/thioredoxin
MKAITVASRFLLGAVLVGALGVAAIIPGMTMGGDVAVDHLGVGSLAPPLSISEWINGGPIAIGDNEHVYVLEFWTTYCPRCLVTAPHLSELQSKFGDRGLIVAGVTPESADVVRAFLKEKAKTISYRIGPDPEWKTGERYMDAVEASQLPYAFIIDREGRVAWHGDPLEPDFDGAVVNALQR